MARTYATPSRHRRQSLELETQLQIALDNMPGALVYTDEKLRIVFCNRRFREMYDTPGDLLRPGQPYPDFLRYLAENVWPAPSASGLYQVVRAVCKNVSGLPALPLAKMEIRASWSS